MVVQMLSIMKKMAASSWSTLRLILRPKTVSRPIFSGMTGGEGQKSNRTHSTAETFHGLPGLTCHLAQAADEQRLVVALCKRDAVTQSVLMVVLDLMFSVSICYTQQVLLQQLGAAQHRAVVQEGGHEPAPLSQTPNHHLTTVSTSGCRTKRENR